MIPSFLIGPSASGCSVEGSKVEKFRGLEAKENFDNILERLNVVGDVERAWRCLNGDIK